MKSLQDNMQEMLYNEYEVKRQYASYEFFSKLIMDNIHTKTICPIVVSLGCCAGFGTKILSNMSGSAVIGICKSKESFDYASMNFSARNIAYACEDLEKYVKKMSIHDYVVSRGNIDIETAKKVKFRQMLIFDVEYEPNIEVKLSETFEYCDLYYEDYDGFITKELPDRPLMMICACKKAVHVKEDVCV